MDLNDGTSKKTPLEDLSRDDLIKRCSALLGIAHKAKQAKDTLQKENSDLKSQLEAFNSNGDHEEIIEHLTQQKIEQTMALEELKLKNRELVNRIRASDDVDNENISFKRQISRLTDENEQLIAQLEILAKQVDEFKELGLEQQQQLLTLEESNKKLISDTETQGKITELQNMLTISLEEVRKLKMENTVINEKMGNLRLNLTEKDRNIITISKELEVNKGQLKQFEEAASHSNKELQENIEKLREKIKFYHSKVVKFSINVKELKEFKNSILAMFKEYMNQVEEWKSQLTTSAIQLLNYLNNLKEENDVLKEANTKMAQQLEAHKTDDEKSKEIDENKRLRDEIASLRGQTKKDGTTIKIMTEENEKYREMITKLDNDIDLSLNQVEDLKSKNFVLQEQLDHLKTNEREFAEKTSEEIVKLVQENAELNRKLSEKVSEISCETQTDPTHSNNTLEETMITLKRENGEVLAEMNEMNQVLKERGETISKLEAHCEEIMKKLQYYETQANKNVDNITQKEEMIKTLQQQLNDNVPNAEEVYELKAEIESLKERINSNLNDSNNAESETMSTSTISRCDEANRLKDLEGSWEERYGKLRSLALKLKGKIRDLTGELAKEQNEKLEIQQKSSSSVKSLQDRCDRLEDELEKSRRESIQLASQLGSVADEISRDKQNLAENDEALAKMKRQLDEFETERANTDKWKKQISTKVQALRKELEASKLTCKEYESNIAKLQSQLELKDQALKVESDHHQQTKNERTKQSVLNLEMQDYERSVNELSQKLEKRQKHINQLEAQIDNLKSTVSALREQNKIADSRTHELEIDLVSSKSEIQSFKKQINDFELVTVQKDDKIASLNQSLEATRSENEELSTELGRVIADHQKIQTSLREDKELLRGHNLGLEQTLRQAQDELRLKLDELKAIQMEYESYKVRAQSVLRQNQSRDVGLEEKLNEELENLKSKLHLMNLELTEVRSNLETVTSERALLIREKDELIIKNREIVEELDDLRRLHEKLASNHQRTVLEHGETVRGLKVHADTLAQCYRQQLAEAEARHNREILELESKIDKVPAPESFIVPSSSLLMRREEGEGSESVESASKLLNSINPIPLERLLGDDLDQEIVYIQKLLNDEQSKVIHLTALLADTEQDLVKHVQMNKLLKDEIRRQQRSEEREKHAENLEYLKNVIFKFATLHSGDERVRLVPVLNTILKLSPEETQKLLLVAKGDTGLRGWLPTWSSPSKS